MHQRVIHAVFAQRKTTTVVVYIIDALHDERGAVLSPKVSPFSTVGRYTCRFLPSVGTLLDCQNRRERFVTRTPHTAASVTILPSPITTRKHSRSLFILERLCDSTPSRRDNTLHHEVTRYWDKSSPISLATSSASALEMLHLLGRVETSGHVRIAIAYTHAHVCTTHIR